MYANQAAFAAQPAQKIFPYPYTQEDLPNGLRLVTVPTDYPNIVALYIVVQVGSRNEIESGHTGFAHLFEHLMFKGTERFSQQRYNDAVKHMGAESNAFTTDDYTCYQTVFSKEDLPATLAMEADRFQNLKFSEGEFKTETLAVLGEYNKNASSPFVKLNEALRDEAYTTHTYKHVTMGFLKDVQDMPNQYDYSLKFFDRYYRPEYTTIIVAGDVKQRPTHDLVVKSWGSLEARRIQGGDPRGAAAGRSAQPRGGMARDHAAADRDCLQEPCLYRFGEGHGGARCPFVSCVFRELGAVSKADHPRAKGGRAVRLGAQKCGRRVVSSAGARQEAGRCGIRSRSDFGYDSRAAAAAGG